MENLINTIFPPKCIFCGKFGRVFCYECLSSCKLHENYSCVVCDKPSVLGKTHLQCAKPNIAGELFCVFAYQDKVRECIRRSKYPPKEFAALSELSEYGVKIAQKCAFEPFGAVIVPIPLNAVKYRDRGFNQSEIIAKVFSKAYNLPVVSELLKRTRNTKIQAGLTKQERQKNLKGAFSINSRELKKLQKEFAQKDESLKILLVDDISTSGSTFLEASKTLKESGITKVSCFALSKKL